MNQVISALEFRELSFGVEDIADGVPMLPPSKQRLASAVNASGRSPDEILGSFARSRPFTVSDLAEIALLAGCREDYLPLLIATFEIMLDPRFPIGLLTDSRASFFPYVIVNGSVRHQLGINCRSNVFGPGFRANATIGRAIRLGLARFAGARMSPSGPSALGTAYRFTCVVGEDEENSPWPPLNTEFGMKAGEDSVMVLVASQPAHVTHQLSVIPTELANAYADELVTTTHFHRMDVALPPEGHAPKAILTIGEDHRGYFRDAGWDRARFKAAMYDFAERDIDEVRSSGYALAGDTPPMERPGGKVSPFTAPDDFLIVAAGSAGGRSMIGNAVYGGIRPIGPVSPQAGALAPVSQAPRTLDDYAGLVTRYMDAGATDGWPVIPPDTESVDALIAAMGRQADEELGRAPWRPNPITVRDAAVNACMAGCSPELMPLASSMLELLFSPEAEAGVGGIAASTGGYNCWFVIQGPAARRLSLNHGAGLFGPGAGPNVALGRTIRLAMMNLAGLKPNLADRSCVGQAYKYGVVIATDEKSPWGPLEFETELGPGETGITLLWGQHTRLIVNEEATTPEQLLRSIADGMATAQNFDSPFGRAPGEEKLAEGGEGWVKVLGGRRFYVVMSQGHRSLIEEAGWTRTDVQAFLAAHAVRTVGQLRAAGYGASPFFDFHQKDDESVRLVTGPEKIIPVAAGGSGGASLAFAVPVVISRRVVA